MTQITIDTEKKTRRIRLYAVGHADTAPRGQDMMCAAISTIIYGLATELAALDPSRFTSRAIRMDDPDEGALIELTCADGKSYRRCLYNLAPVERSLQILAMEHPQAVSLQTSKK
jgi:uncharacterized protein YsxB (DUF464 family)